jgi:hypothetical protein
MARANTPGRDKTAPKYGRYTRLYYAHSLPHLQNCPITRRRIGVTLPSLDNHNNPIRTRSEPACQQPYYSPGARAPDERERLAERAWRERVVARDEVKGVKLAGAARWVWLRLRRTRERHRSTSLELRVCHFGPPWGSLWLGVRNCVNSSERRERMLLHANTPWSTRDRRNHAPLPTLCATFWRTLRSRSGRYLINTRPVWTIRFAGCEVNWPRMRWRRGRRQQLRLPVFGLRQRSGVLGFRKGGPDPFCRGMAGGWRAAAARRRRGRSRASVSRHASRASRAPM